jgi:four helix bundle protein
MLIRSAKELTVYQKAYALSMRVFELSCRFPPEERFALCSQIRRSSRSIRLNLREAWAKRRFPAHFVSRLTDCDGENSETDSSLDFAKDCNYISAAEHGELAAMCVEIGRMLGAMLRNPGPFLLSPAENESRVREDDPRELATDFRTLTSDLLQ